MNFFVHLPHSKPKEEHPIPIQLPEQRHNIYEGSEFLDDAIRTHEQPLIYTEESVAAGSRTDLL